MYCIIDVETTGGSAAHSRITEIAIFKTDGKKILDSYSTLINPGRSIPQNIVRLTGINDAMVAQAPPFSLVASKIDSFTKDCIFIAHNVNFDYSFIRSEFERIGMSYRRKKLCTVRLSRQLFKGKASYSLGKLCKDLNIPVLNRHRAFGDAEATVLLFHLLLSKDTNKVVENSLKPQSLEALLPPNLPKSEFISLPEEQGIYYLKDARSKIVYIGQAKNIKQRIHSHFSGNSNTKTKHYFAENIHSIDYQLVPNAILLDLKEAIDIKKHWPRYNRSMKRFTLNYGLFTYLDQKGYKRLALGKCGKYEKPIASFKSREESISVLKDLILEFELCPRLAGLQPISSGKCNYIEEIECKGACHEQESTCDYNQRVEKGIHEKLKSKNTYLLEDHHQDQKAIILVEEGRLKGYGTIPSNHPVGSIQEARELLSATYDDQDLSAILQRHLTKFSENKAITYF